MVTKKQIFQNIKHYDQDEVIEKLFLVTFFNFLLAKAKGIKYQDSWCKRGLFSISQNLERKTDRLQNQLFPRDGEPLTVENLGLGKKESFLDTLSDESNYCNLALVYFMKKVEEINEPELFNNFIEDQSDFIVSNLSPDQVVSEVENVIDLLQDLRDDLKNSDPLKDNIKDFIHVKKRIN